MTLLFNVPLTNSSELRRRIINAFSNAVFVFYLFLYYYDNDSLMFRDRTDMHFVFWVLEAALTIALLFEKNFV